MITIAVILAIAWLLGLTAFHVTSGLIHLLIVFAAVAFVAHVMSRGRRPARGVL